MQEFLETNITAFIKKAIAENDSGMEELIRNYGIEGVKKQLLSIYGIADEVLKLENPAEPYKKVQIVRRNCRQSLPYLLMSLLHVWTVLSRKQPSSILNCRI